jgi:acetyltransferase-like isoleucine patch superfamily enzyme
VIGDGIVLWEEASLSALPKARIGPGANMRPPTILYPGVEIGARFASGHFVTIRERTTIGDDCSVGTSSVIERDVKVASGVRLHSRVFVPEYTVIEEGAWLGPAVVVTNAKYPASAATKANLVGVHIGVRAKVGAGAVLLPGVRLGADCLVGAGAVVTRDVPAGAVVIGNPARVVGKVTDKKFADGSLVYQGAQS